MICRRAAEVITQSLDSPPPLHARVGLRVHILFCSPCRRFRRQMLQLHAAVSQVTESAAASAGGGLSEVARERITTALNRADEPR